MFDNLHSYFVADAHSAKFFSKQSWLVPSILFMIAIVLTFIMNMLAVNLMSQQYFGVQYNLPLDAVIKQALVPFIINLIAMVIFLAVISGSLHFFVHSEDVDWFKLTALYYFAPLIVAELLSLISPALSGPLSLFVVLLLFYNLYKVTTELVLPKNKLKAFLYLFAIFIGAYIVSGIIAAILFFTLMGFQLSNLASNLNGV